MKVFKACCQTCQVVSMIGTCVHCTPTQHASFTLFVLKYGQISGVGLDLFLETERIYETNIAKLLRFEILELSDVGWDHTNIVIFFQHNMMYIFKHKLQCDLQLTILILCFQFVAAQDRLWFLLEIYSWVDYFTITPSFLSIYLNRSWIGGYS